MLINCPHNSNYNGYSFWYPAKLIRSGRNSASISIGYNEEFTFKLKKYGKGKFNRNDIIDKKEIKVDKFEEMFKMTDKNIISV